MTVIVTALSLTLPLNIHSLMTYSAHANFMLMMLNCTVHMKLVTIQLT